MGIVEYIVTRDKFEFDEDSFDFSFPCCACVHRRVRDVDMPCIKCDHNTLSKPDDD
jgi:hypothetical protein